MEALKQFIVRLIETNIVEFGPRKVKQFIDRYKNKENDIRNLKKEDFTYVMKIATSYKMKKELKDIKILWKRWLLYNIGDAFYSHHSAEKESMKEWIQLNKKLKTRNSSYMFPTILAGYGTHKLDDEDVGINPVEAIYYETENGVSEIYDFINNQKITDKSKILAWISTLEEQGPTLPRPYADILKNGIHELRVKLSGKQTRTLYFFCYKDYIVLTHTFIKNTDKVPEKEIKKAEKIREDFLNRYDEEKLREEINENL